MNFQKLYTKCIRFKKNIIPGFHTPHQLFDLILTDDAFAAVSLIRLCL